MHIHIQIQRMVRFHPYICWILYNYRRIYISKADLAGITFWADCTVHNISDAPPQGDAKLAIGYLIVWRRNWVSLLQRNWVQTHTATRTHPALMHKHHRFLSACPRNVLFSFINTKSTSILFASHPQLLARLCRGVEAGGVGIYTKLSLVL